MNRPWKPVLIAVFVCVGASAQTTVTTSGGTTHNIPAFNGTASLGSSPIYAVGANVGLSWDAPVATLDVGGFIHAYGNTNQSIGTQGAYLGWNTLTGGTGETDLMNSRGGGGGGFAFMNGGGGSTTIDTLMFLEGTGRLGIGTVAPGEKLEVSGNIKLTSSSGGHIVFADGSQQSVAWTGVLSGGDYAESVDVTGDRTGFEPGDVLVIDPKSHGHFQKTSTPYSALVGGVYATKPGVTGRRQPRTKSIEDEVPMAMVGIVQTKVSTENGPIHDGDLLVSSSTPGYAMKGPDRDRMMGAVIGKALASLETGSGVIEVLILLQ